MRTKVLAVLTCAMLAVCLTNAQSDDFNRANGPLGPNWKDSANGTFRVESNLGRGQGSNHFTDWIGTPQNTLPYYDVIGSLDIFSAGHTGLHYAALRTGVGTDELYIKVQSQSSPGQFSHVGFYHRTGATSFGSWGGTGFMTLPTKFASARITTYFQAPDKDTIYLDIDTDFNGTPEFTYNSPGVLGIAGNLGMGVGIGSYGGSGSESSEFDNFLIIPEPASLSLLVVAGLALIRRR